MTAHCRDSEAGRARRGKAKPQPLAAGLAPGGFRGAWRGLGICPFPALLSCPFAVRQPCSTSCRNASTLKAWEAAPVQDCSCAGRVLQQQGGGT